MTSPHVRYATAAKAKTAEKPANRALLMMILSAVAMVVLAIFMVVAAPVLAAGTSSDSDTGSGGNAYQAPKSDSADMRKAIAAIKNEQFEIALGHLKTETTASPQNADAWNLTGYASRKLGRYGESAVAYDKALAINPKHKGALEYKGELHLTLGQLDKAEELLARLKTHCSFNCAEVKTLTKAIVAYKKAN